MGYGSLRIYDLFDCNRSSNLNFCQMLWSKRIADLIYATQFRFSLIKACNVDPGVIDSSKKNWKSMILTSWPWALTYDLESLLACNLGIACISFVGLCSYLENWSSASVPKLSKDRHTDKPTRPIKARLSVRIRAWQTEMTNRGSFFRKKMSLTNTWMKGHSKSDRLVSESDLSSHWKSNSFFACC